MPNVDLSLFLKKHSLPERYLHTAEKWFVPFAKQLADRQKRAKKPIVIGINGAQGSGKSTLTDLLVYLLKEQYQLQACALSIDDFYLTQKQRIELSKKAHPLLRTRGVPGTHDAKHAQLVIEQLVQGLPTTIPRFNKANDDREPEDKWDVIVAPVDIIVVEGWCLGVAPQQKEALITPCNDLEQKEDPAAIWRTYINEKLAGEYLELFSVIDVWTMLKAPSFENVFNWRKEQENKLRLAQGLRNKTMDDAAIERFIKHYQRITEHALETLPTKADYLFELDAQRNIITFLTKNEVEG